MTAASIDGGFDMPADSWRGSTSLEAYLQQSVSRE
jgi:hypothetical protein